MTNKQSQRSSKRSPNSKNQESNRYKDKYYRQFPVDLKKVKKESKIFCNVNKNNPVFLFEQRKEDYFPNFILLDDKVVQDEISPDA